MNKSPQFLSKARIRQSVVLVTLLLCQLVSHSQNVIVSGSAGSANGSYATLKAAFDALNLVTDQTGKYVTVSIAANTTETASAALNQPSIGNWTSLTISPSGGAARTISGSLTTPIINLNGADRVTINGLNTGSNSLTISNTSTTGGSAVQLINDATSNTIKSCTLKSLFPSATSGVINFLTTTGTTGNDGNTIDLCAIDCGAGATASPTLTARNGIYSAGTTTTSALNNSGNTVSNCTIFNFFAAAAATNGIFISTGNTDWTISNNSFYQTNTRTVTTAATHTAINISNTSSGNNFLVSGNYIGGDSPNAVAGTAKWTVTGAFTTVFNGITLNVGTTTASSIQGNTIRNLSIQSASTANEFVGINVTAGNVSIGTVSANVIGSTTVSATTAAASSIALLQSTSNGGVGCGIFSSSTGTVNISNNTIGGFYLAAAAGANTLGNTFYGIRLTAGTNNVYGNTVGSTSNANSIYSEGSKNTTTNANILAGISMSAGTNAIGGNGLNQGNTISNISYSASGGTGPTTAETVFGIHATAGTNTIVKNVVSNLSNVSGNTGTGSSASVVGVYVQSNAANHTVSQNTISNLVNSHASAAVTVQGIFYNSSTGTNLVERNLIYNLDASNASALLHGIWINGGTTTYQNNIIRLGTNGNAATLGMTINGIAETIAGTDNLYFNSIYIGGAPTTAANNSFAFQSSITTNTRNYRNNIFWNARSNSGSTGKHYAIRVGGTAANPAGLTSNHNDLLATGTGGFVGLFNAVDRTFATWQSATGQDANSINADPLFTNATSATPDLHVLTSTPVNAVGFAIGSVTRDFDGDYRSNLTPTDIGADAYDAVCTAAIGGTATGSASYCGSGTPSITATGFSTGAGTTYEWMSSTNAADYTSGGTAVYGQTDPTTLTVGTISTTTYYWLKVSCATNASIDYSNLITITVFNLAAGNNVSTCDGAGAINITSGAVNNNYSVATWTSNGTGSFTDATSVTTATYNPSAADVALGSVTLTLTGTATSPCPLATSTKTLTINQAAPTTTNASLCAGSTSIALTATSLCKQSITTFGGTITSSSPVAHRPVSGANTNSCGFQQTPGDIRAYNMLNFRVTVSGNYIFTMDDNANYDAIAYIVRDTLGTSFVPGLCPTDPGGGGKLIREDDDDSPVANEPRLGYGGPGFVGLGTMYLIAGVDYYMVTTFFDNPTLPQSFSWTITGPAGGGQVVNQSPSDATIYWYDAPVNGNLVATGGTFDPVPNILANTNTVATTTYYAACSNNLTCRTAAVYDITPNTIPSTAGTISVTNTQADGSSVIYKNACEMTMLVTDPSGGNTLGSTTITATKTSANIAGGCPRSGQVYVSRYYDVNPTSDGTATMTFYFTQTDFDLYNASNGSLYDMPTSGSNSDPNVGNIRMAQITNGTLLTGAFNYPTVSVNWNSSTSLWEVTTTTNAKGLFYLYTDPACNIAITGFGVTGTTATTADFSWNSAAGAIGYELRTRIQGATSWITSNGWTGTTAHFTGLTPGATYEVQMKARCSTTTSSLFTCSIYFTAGVQSCPTPTNLVVSNVTPVSATFSWTALSSPVTTYVVRWKVNGTNTWLNSANSPTNSITIYQFQAGVTYDVQVLSWCPSINMLSPYSNTLTYQSGSHPVCTTPTNLAVVGSPTATSATISWDNMAGTTSYIARWREVGTTTWSAGGGLSNPRLLGGLLAGKTYECQVASWCGVISQLTAYSSLINFTTPSPKAAASIPFELSTFTGEGKGQDNLLQWTSAFEHGLDKYKLYRESGDGQFELVTELASKTPLNEEGKDVTYSYTHQNVTTRENVYHLEGIDFEGNTYSANQVVRLSNDSPLQQVDIYPNPSDDVLHIDFTTAQSSDLQIRLVDVTGRLIKEIHAISNEGNNQFTVDLNECSSGMYLVQIIENGQISHVAKVQKK